MKLYLSILLITCCWIAGAAQHPFFSSDLYVSDQSELKAGENIDEKIANNLFLRAEVSKTTCYVGENIMAEFKAYARLNADSRVLQRPSLTGFSVIEMVDAYNSFSDKERYKGVTYYTHLIRKVQLFPLQAGEFKVEPAEIESIVSLKKNELDNAPSSASGVYPQKTKTSTIQKQVNISTPVITIKVNPLPEKGRPEDYSGAVGEFTVRMEVEDVEVEQFQPLVARLIIAGTGNLSLITDPDIEWPSQTHLPDVQVSEDIDKYRFPLKGRKTFEYTLATKDIGSFTIPPVHFNYFDPEKGTYQSVATDEVRYTVKPAEENDNNIVETDIINHHSTFPLHYIYFGIIVAVIAGVVIYQLRKSKQ